MTVNWPLPLRSLSALGAGLALASAAYASTPSADGETLLLQSPTVSDDHVVFEYAGDLWIVDRTGGDARRLTSSSGLEQNPRLGPDGKTVAFTGQYEGNIDVYTISIDGGIPQRLTWHPGPDVVTDWHPGGKHVVFRSTRSSGAPVNKLFAVSTDGGTPLEIEIPKVFHASISDDAALVAYTPFRDAFRSWKRHRGGTASTIWIFDPDTKDVEVVPHENASDTFPVWLNGDVYFASDRDGTMDLYRYTPGGGDVEQLTHYTDFDIRNMDAGGGVVVYEQAGALHIWDPANEKSTRLEIRVQADGLAAVPRWQEVEGHVRAASIAPNGKRAVFEARGEIISMPREHGDARNLTQSPGAHDRTPSWSNDGKRIAWFSDASGEYRLMVGDDKGEETPKSYDPGPGGFYRDPVWSPNDEHILFSDKTNRLAYLTLETGEVTTIAKLQGSLGEVRPTGVWSPDSKWIAFANRNPRTLYDHIALYEIATGTITSVTDGFGAASDPAFSTDGELLFFSATVDVGPNLFGLDMSASASRDPEENLFVAVLKKDGTNPLAPRSDEAYDDEKADDEKADDEADEKTDDDGAEDGEKVAVEASASDEAQAEEEESEEDTGPSIDLEGLDQRILALPIGSGDYGDLACADKKLLYLEYDGRSATLKAFDFDSRKSKTVTEGVNGFDVSTDGKSILTASRGEFQIMGADGGDAKPIAIAKVKVRVEPEEEWPQMLREVWRIQRDYFYDPNMHGVDWPKMWDRWSAFLPYVKHRGDLTVLVSEMIGELSCGHQYTWGGESEDAPEGVAVGLLGADFEADGKRFKIANIYRGQNWNPDLRAPLTTPGVDANEGDYLIAVNGRDVTTDDNLFEAFADTAERQISLTLASSASGTDARTVTVVPLRSDARLRRQSWIEDNRKRVDEMSGGRLAYIYMPNTADAGRAAFDRDFYSQLDKEGVVIDERYNGGGQVANYVIDVLSRKPMSYWMNREQWVASSPFGIIEGPKVMVINESAGSGGDWMPWTFQNRELGPLVGTRTWGGLVGISGYPPLMDGGAVTAASFGVMDTEGNWAVENVGVSPDVEVIEWPKEVLAGHDPQLERAVQLAMQELQSGGVSTRPASYRPPAKR